MNADQINQAFEEYLSQRSAARKFKIKANYVAQLRHKVRTGQMITLDLKMQLLQQAGWKQPDISITRAEALQLLKFYRKQSEAAKELGEEYILEKFLNSI